MTNSNPIQTFIILNVLYSEILGIFLLMRLVIFTSKLMARIRYFLTNIGYLPLNS